MKAAPKPVIFTISAIWDAEAGVWSGYCDEIPAAADAPTLDGVLAKISAMTLDLLPDNIPKLIRTCCVSYQLLSLSTGSGLNPA